MPRAIVDTTVLYAAGNDRAHRHETGLSIVRGIDNGRLPTGDIPDPILIETMNGLSRDIGPSQAIDVLDRLERGASFRIRRESRSVWETGIGLFQRIPRLSLADAILVAAARGDEVDYCYSFDSDFDGIEGIRRVSTASNPFEPE